jgi:ATP-dependent Clp protease ATP-binding subunit ClpA
MVAFTQAAGRVSRLAQQEARRLDHQYLGPEHHLLGLLLEGDNLAARVLRAHGLDLEAVRAEVDRLIANGVLPSPKSGDAELLATLGIDLEAVHGRVKATFGDKAYGEAAQRVGYQPAQTVGTRHTGRPPVLMCGRALNIAHHEAVARDREIGPELLLLGLLRDAQEPVDTTDLYAEERRRRPSVGLPEHGPPPIKVIVEARGLTLETLLTALRSKLDRVP